jgi:hypothetical protein
MTRASGTLDFRLIATWLGLPPGPWPPDHYTLLGLPARETNQQRIEQQVHERLMRVRSYQLSNPELATEAMKRLAQAFDCLTTPKSKKAYDDSHFPLPALPLSSPRVPTTLAHDTTETTPVPATPPPRPAPAPLASAPAHDAAAQWARQELVWKAPSAPPPVRGPGETPPLEPPPVRVPTAEVVVPPPVRVPPPAPAVEPPPVRVPPPPEPAPEPPPPMAIPLGPPLVAALPPPPAPPPPVPASPPPPVVQPPSALHPAAWLPSNSGAVRVLTSKPADPVFEAAKSSPALRQGLVTRHNLYNRLVWLRQILSAWERVGKLVSKPKKRLTRTADEADLGRQLEIIEELLLEQESLLGQPGQPGYRVMALGRLEKVAATFNGLDEQQRDLLARDWIAGRTLLRSHGRFLRERVRGWRRLSGGQRWRRSIDATLTDYRNYILLFLGLTAVLVLAGVYFL